MRSGVWMLGAIVLCFALVFFSLCADSVHSAPKGKLVWTVDVLLWDW